MLKKALYIVAIILAAVAVSGFLKQPEKPAKKVQVIYTVQAGDTVWGIACRAAEEYGYRGDVRIIVDRIAKDNGGTVDIYPGQKLAINMEVQQ